MKNKLTKVDGSKDLLDSKRLYLLNMDNGRVLDWTAYLSVRKGFIDCTKDGQPINPADVPGDHPWIIEQSKGLVSRLRSEGAKTNFIQQVGNQLIAEGIAKFKSLNYEKSKTLNLEHNKSAAQVGATIRIYKKIDRMCAAAKAEIQDMVNAARLKLGLN